jgi:hypothetical protein
METKLLREMTAESKVPELMPSNWTISKGRGMMIGKGMTGRPYSTCLCRMLERGGEGHMTYVSSWMIHISSWVVNFHSLLRRTCSEGKAIGGNHRLVNGGQYHVSNVKESICARQLCWENEAKWFLRTLFRTTVGLRDVLLWIVER